MSLGSVYVVFEKASIKRWWTRFLHCDISHCYIIKPEKGRWLVCSKTLNEVEIYTIDGYGDILANTIVVKTERTQRERGLFMLNTCVGSVKQYLGVRNPFIFTPYQLYKRLTNDKLTKKTKKNS